MSAASDRTARLRYCNTEGQGKSCCCQSSGISTVCISEACNTVKIDPSNNTMCLSEACNTIKIDPSNNTICLGENCNTIKIDPDFNTVTCDLSGATIIADISGLTTTLDLANATGDAFARLRVSNPYTLFEFNSILGLNKLLIDGDVSGGGLITHSTTQSYVALTVPDVSGAYVIRQSHEYIQYQPGKSKLVLMTGVLTTANVAGSVARIGCFDAEMGVFLQKSNGNTSVVMRNNSVDTAIPQASWTDLSGTDIGAGGVDFNKAQIFVFDFEWLGVGQVRCGIMVNGIIRYYYTFKHYNALTAPYIPMAKLPLRYEIRKTSTGGGGAEMRMICGTVMSEGGLTPLGQIFTKGVFTYNTRISVDASGGVSPYKPLMAIRLRSNARFPRTTLKIKQIDVFSADANKFGSWQLLLNPTTNILDASWNDVNFVYNSAAQFVVNNTAGTFFDISAGTGNILYTDYYSSRTNSVASVSTDELVLAYPITTGLSGVSDVVVLVANHITSGSDSVSLYCYLRWLEII